MGDTDTGSAAGPQSNPQERGPSLRLRSTRSYAHRGRRTSTEVTDLRKENARLKEVVAETVLENRLLKKSVLGSGSPEDEA